MTYELIKFPNGSHSVRSLQSGEAMHSRIGAWEEAQKIYIEPSQLARLARDSGGPVVVHDVGMGIAANALAAIEAFEQAERRRSLHLISFEKHLDGLRLALESKELFPWLVRHEPKVRALLCTGRHESNRVTWELRAGDFVDQPLDPPADLVFFDFYSPRTDPELWLPEIFARIHSAVTPRARLITYSSAKTVRCAMMEAGFYVGVGAATEAKTQTTIAAMRLEDLDDPLAGDWLESLTRSSKPLPIERIRLHPQFVRE